MKKYPKKDEWKREQSNSLMASINLEAKLNLLVDEIIDNNDASKLNEFYHFLHYAPPETRVKLLDKIDSKRK
jgi:hypothetical protein